MSSTKDVYEARGYGGSTSFGTRPALVVVDFSVGFTDPSSPLHCDSDDALVATAELLAAAREGGSPVVFTTVAYEPGDLEVARAFVAKAPALASITPDSPWAAIDPRIAPRADEPVLRKLFASGFFGTALASLLASHGCDGVVVVGASTSGCVRATAIDAVQYGYPTLVVRDGVADRAEGAHEASLTDLQAKYADVVSTAEAARALRRTAA